MVYIGHELKLPLCSTIYASYIYRAVLHICRLYIERKHANNTHTHTIICYLLCLKCSFVDGTRGFISIVVGFVLFAVRFAARGVCLCCLLA